VLHLTQWIEFTTQFAVHINDSRVNYYYHATTHIRPQLQIIENTACKLFCIGYGWR